MDNPKKNDRRISIVLNGKEALYRETEVDKQAKEELFNMQISATKEEQEHPEDFDWLLPSQQQSSAKVVDLGERRKGKKILADPYWDDGKSEASPKLPPTKRKKSPKFDFHSLPLGLIAIVLSAIIVGVSFGFMMLTIFTGEKPTTEFEASNVKDSPQAEAPVTTTANQIPTLGVEIIQGGAFSVVAKGQETAQMLKNKGFAAVLTNTTDPIYLFIGLGLDRDQATIVADQYKANGQDVYLKPYAVTANKQLKNQEQFLYLQSGVQLFQQLTQYSIHGLANTTKANNEVALAFESFTALGDPFKNNEIQHQHATAFKGALTNAYEKMQNFATSKDNVNLWQAQQYLLNGLIAYEELVKVL